MVSDKRLSELADEKMICKLSWEEETSVAQELQKYRQMYRWIPVGERLPDYSSIMVLCMDEDGSAWIAYYDKFRGKWHDGDFHDDIAGITHWMPLPEPPV